MLVTEHERPRCRGAEQVYHCGFTITLLLPFGFTSSGSCRLPLGSTSRSRPIPSPAPTATPVPRASGECRVGLRLGPGDECSHGGFSMRIRSDGAAVLGGNIGGIQMGNMVMDTASINLNNLRLSRTGSIWTIESLPR